MINEPSTFELAASDEPTGVEAQPKPEIPSGDEVAAVVGSFYNQLGPKLGCRLVEPSAVLTFAGLKGSADLASIPVTTSDVAHHTDPIVFGDVSVSVPQPHEQERFGRVKVRNQRFLERAYQRQSALEAQLVRRFGDLTENDRNIAEQGLELGYPDIAILDFAEWCRMNLEPGKAPNVFEEVDLLDEGGVPEHYRGSYPEFDVRRDHLGHPAVMQYRNQATQVLREFYSSKTFRQLEQDPIFRSTYAAVERFHDELLMSQRNRQKKLLEQQTMNEVQQ